MMLFRILQTKDLSVLGNICNFAKNNLKEEFLALRGCSGEQARSPVYSLLFTVYRLLDIGYWLLKFNYEL